MTDFYNRHMEIGDKCVRYSGWIGGLEEVTVVGLDKKIDFDNNGGTVIILNSFNKEVSTNSKKLVDISALMRAVLKQS